MTTSRAVPGSDRQGRQDDPAPPAERRRRTRAATPWPGKGIHYRMNRAHVGGLAAARIDACSLASNHVLDWSAAIVPHFEST